MTVRSQSSWRARFTLTAAGLLLCLTAAAAFAQESVLRPTSIGAPVRATVFRGDVRDLPQIPPVKHEPRKEFKSPPTQTGTFVDPVVQSGPLPMLMPAPISTFAGLDFANWGAGWPPDTVGDIGANHYVEAVNTSVGIYRKSDHAQLAAFTFDTLWSQANSGTACDNANNGDPVVNYDPIGHRWIISDFAWANYTSGAMYQCFAVSMTSDPVSGGWYFYAVQTHPGGQIADYPKVGVWPDGIYFSANMFATTGTGAFQNARVWALNRQAMEAGQPLQAVMFNLPQRISGIYVFSVLPSNMSGALPPVGTPNYFVSVWGTPLARVWKFAVDWTNPANSTFTGPANIAIPAYTSAPGTIPARDGNNLDSLGSRVMMQNQYRNLSGTESLWFTHTVANGAIASIRWYQVNVTGGTIPTAAPAQSGTFNPDSTHRFLPSLAVDRQGNMAVGYTASSSTLYPSIRYAGRLASDPAGQLSQGEATLFAGTGSQCCNFSDGTANDRWGDYSAMTVDPSDECTFWYTNEYYDTLPTTLAADNWKTRIGSFRFPGCIPLTNGTLQGTVVNASSTPIVGATVTAGAFSTTTNVNGFYEFPVIASASYSMTVTATGYTTATASGIAVTTGNITTQNFTLTAGVLPTITSIVPGAGSTAGGETVTITGSNLSGASLTVGGASVTPSSTTATTVVYTSPAHIAGAVTVTVTTTAGTASTTYAYVAPPVAADDTYSTNEDITLTVAAPGVLTNDTGGPLTAQLVSTTTHGALTLDGPGSFTYVPSANFNGSDSFTYRAYNGVSTSNLATASITVNAVNDPPVGGNDSYSAVTNAPLVVAAPGVLVNDTDVDSTTLTASLVTNVTHGSLTLNGDGSFTYTASTGYVGIDTFVYRAYDGAAYSGNTTATINVVASTPTIVSLVPDNGPDAGGTSFVITGTNFVDGATVSVGGTAVAVTFNNSTSLTVTSPALPPGTLNDVVVTNPDSGSASSVKGWMSDFLDVDTTNVFHDNVEKIFRMGLTGGCGNGNYCGGDVVPRQQMAAFVSRGMVAGADDTIPFSGLIDKVPYSCTAGGFSIYNDVTTTQYFCRHIHYIASHGVTSGCTPTTFCPNDPIERGGMAAFISRSLTGSDAAVPGSVTLVGGVNPWGLPRDYDCGDGLPNHFPDVPDTEVFCRHISYIWVRGIIDGFADGTYGPRLLVNRFQMAKYLANSY